MSISNNIKFVIILPGKLQMTTNNSSVQEEEKETSGASQLARYNQPVKEYKNPLIHNKGSAHFNKESILYILNLVVFQEKNLQSCLQLNPLGGNQLDCIEKKDSLGNKNSEGSFSNTSEFDIAETQMKANDHFLPPPFEHHGTMHISCQGKKEELKLATSLSNRQKCQAMTPEFSNLIQTEQKDKVPIIIKTEQTETQIEYFNKVNAITTNYMTRILSDSDVYIQYVSLLKVPIPFVNSQEFNLQKDKLMKNRGQFERNLEKFNSKFFF